MFSSNATRTDPDTLLSPPRIWLYSMPHLLFCCAPLAEETRLLTDCYPPKKQLPSSTSFNPALPSAGLDTVKPLSQELSRLTYYAANKPGKLRKIGEELEARVTKHTRAAKAGNGKGRV